MEIGHKVYYYKASGEVIFKTSEMSGSVRETTIEEDFEFYPQLLGHNQDKIGMLQLEYGLYNDDFAHAASYYVEPMTAKLIFDYHNNRSTNSE